MELHRDKERFADAIMAASVKFGFEPALIEKDYFATLFLKYATKRIDGLVFKGGTSLSKCYKIINRFSEDVDLTLDTEHFTQSRKRNSVKELISICDDLRLVLLDRKTIQLHTHGNYNKFEIQYPAVFSSADLKPELIVEMTYIQKSYPSEKSLANSYVGEFLQGTRDISVSKKYDLEPFFVQVQSLSRTLIDKVFAICDYFLSGNCDRNSRHIYDISKLITKVNICDECFRSLISCVRNDRKRNKTCLSAQDGASVPEVLEEIIKTEFFKKDYDAVTSKLLVEDTNYEDAIEALQIMIDSKAFNS